MTGCTTEECGRTSELYLCTRCIIELDELLTDVPFLRVNLDPVLQATKVTKRAGNSGGSGTNNTASRPPTSIDAGLTRQWLAVLPDRAYTEATNNPDAGQTLYMARIWVNNARRLVWGNKAETVNHEDLKKQVEDIAPAMPTRHLLPFLREKAGISVTGMDIRNWVRRGHLRPIEREPQPTYLPHEVLAAWNRKETA